MTATVETPPVSETPPSVTTPWMTAAEAAAYSRRNRETLYLALAEYVQTGGKRGLRGEQTGPRCSWSIHRDDLDAWIRRERPKRRRPS